MTLLDDLLDRRFGEIFPRRRETGEFLAHEQAASPMWAAANAGLARREVEHLRYVQENPHEAAMEDESARERFELPGRACTSSSPAPLCARLGYSRCGSGQVASGAGATANGRSEPQVCVGQR